MSGSYFQGNMVILSSWGLGFNIGILEEHIQTIAKPFSEINVKQAKIRKDIKDLKDPLISYIIYVCT